MTNKWFRKLYKKGVVRLGSELPELDQLVYCHGMTESVKVHRKDQSVKDFTSKYLFLLFWLI